MFEMHLVLPKYGFKYSNIMQLIQHPIHLQQLLFFNNFVFLGLFITNLKRIMMTYFYTNYAWRGDPEMTKTYFFNIFLEENKQVQRYDNFVLNATIHPFNNKYQCSMAHWVHS